MTMDEILAEAAKKGLILNNLFQLMTYPADKHVARRPTGEWQANFVHASGWYDYGRGPSYITALEDALARANGKKGPENRPIPREIKEVEKREFDLDDVI